MADDPKVPNVSNFKDAASLSQKITENLKANEEIIKRTQKIVNDNSNTFLKISKELQNIYKGLEKESASLEKAKKLEIEKQKIKKLSNVLENKSNELATQNEIIQKRIENFSKQQLKTTNKKVADAEKNLKATREQILTQEIQLEYDKQHNNLSAEEIQNRAKAIRASEEKLKVEEETLTKAKSALEGREKELSILKEAQAANEKIITQLDKEAERTAQIAKHYTGNKLALEAVNGITGKLSKIPIAKNFIDASKASEAMTKNIEKGGSGIGTLFKGLAAGIRGLETASVILTIFQAAKMLFDLIKDAMFGADKQVTSLAKNLSVSKEEARILRDNFRGVSDSVAGIYGTMPNLIDAQLQLSELSNATTMFSRNQLETQVELTKLLGLSVEEATKLQSNFVLSKGEASEQVDIVYDQVAAFSNQNKILFNGKKILSEMSKVSGQILSTFRGSTEALAKAIMRAEAVGMTLEQARKSAQGLLNFESSIESELEAELLTGRQLNLERARGLALQGDYAGVAEEIASQVGDFYEFGKLNVLQQEALAQSVGMQADELADVLKRREFITKEVQGELDRTRALAKEARAKGETDKAYALEQRAAAIEKGILEGKSLKTAQESVDAQEKFAQAVEIVKAKFQEMFTGEFVDKLGDTLIKLANFLQDFINSVMNKGLWETLTGEGVQEEAAKRTREELAQGKGKVEELRKAGASQSEIDKAIADQSKLLTKAQQAENKRAEEADIGTGTYLGRAGLYGAAGAAIGSVVPGLGTAIGGIVGATTGLVVSGVQDLLDKGEAQQVQDTLIRPGQKPIKFDKDDIILAGTNIFGEKDRSKQAIFPPEIQNTINPVSQTPVSEGVNKQGGTINSTAEFSEFSSNMGKLITSVDELLKEIKNPKEVVIQNNLSVDSQKFFAEASKHSVQFNS